MPSGPAVTAASLGAWLLKAAPDGGAVEELARHGFEDVTVRCVRTSYRTRLVEPGQPVLLWVSGADDRHPSGIHATGETTGPVRHGPDGPVMPVRLRAVRPFVPRRALLADPTLAGAEVLRFAAGSNPSYLDAEQWAALRTAFPQVDHRDRPGAPTT
jgi:hypothetical protein